MLALGGGDTTWLDMCARQRQVGEFANEAAVVALAEVYKLTQLKALHVPTLRHVRTARQLLQHHMAGQLLLQLQNHKAHCKWQLLARTTISRRPSTRSRLVS